MSRIILTSFFKSKLFKGERFSVARWQPKGFNYKLLDFLAARDRFGYALHLSAYKEDPLKQYKDDWEDMILTNQKKVDRWIHDLERGKEDVVLCCWCPYSKPTQKQIKRFGTFACHTGLIGQLLKRNSLKIDILLDDDRKNFLVKEWRP